MVHADPFLTAIVRMIQATAIALSAALVVLFVKSELL